MNRNQENSEKQVEQTFTARAQSTLQREEYSSLEKGQRVFQNLQSALEKDVEIKKAVLRTAVEGAKETYDKINIFSILKIERREDPQSYFLAWILDPCGSHNLGDTFLKELLRKACSIVGNCQFHQLKVSDVQVTPQKSAEDSGVPDIEIEGGNFICVIENKVLAGETITGNLPQTRRYADYYEERGREKGKHILLLYLVPMVSKQPSDDRFKQILYTDIVHAVKVAIETAEPKPEVKYVIDMFLYNIQREIYHQFDDYFEAEELIQLPVNDLLHSDKYGMLVALTSRIKKGGSYMTEIDKPFEFSDTVNIYCKNYNTIKTYEDEWRRETYELAKRIEDKLSNYDIEWDIHFANTEGNIRKRIWGDDPPIKFDFVYDRNMIGNSKFEVRLNIKQEYNELQKRICSDLGEKFINTFKVKPNSTGKYIVIEELPIEDDSYEEAIIAAVRICMDFATNLDPYIAIKKTNS